MVSISSCRKNISYVMDGGRRERVYEVGDRLIGEE